MSGSPQDEIVCSISYFKKRPDLSHEQFYNHWEHVHGPLVKPWMKKHGFLSYTQVHATQTLNSGVASVGPETSRDKNPLQVYDGAAIIQVRSFDQFAAAFQDEYYRTVIAPDEARFLDKEAGVVRTRGEAKKIL